MYFDFNSKLSSFWIIQYKKDGDEGDSESASRGNWWEGKIANIL